MQGLYISRPHKYPPVGLILYDSEKWLNSVWFHTGKTFPISSLTKLTGLLLLLFYLLPKHS